MYNIILRITTMRYENRNKPELNPQEDYVFRVEEKPTESVLRLLEDSHNKTRGLTKAVVIDYYKLGGI